MAEFNRPKAPNPQKVQLGNGVLVFNFNPEDWDDEKMIVFGATRGGGNYNVEKTNRAVRFDGDKGESTKDLKVIDEWVINITANALELDIDALKRAMPGEVKEVEGTDGKPGYKILRPNAQYKEEDYFDNMAYITSTYGGNVVAYVIENVLGDGNLSAAFEDKNEIVPELTFTGYFDREEMDKVPTYIVEYQVTADATNPTGTTETGTETADTTDTETTDPVDTTV